MISDSIKHFRISVFSQNKVFTSSIYSNFKSSVYTIIKIHVGLLASKFSMTGSISVYI